MSSAQSHASSATSSSATRLFRQQLMLLAGCQALLYINNVTLIAVNGLAGLALAPQPAWATLPITTYIIGSALTTMPASLAMGRYGRRIGFMFGALIGSFGTLIAAAAMLLGSFWLLCAGTFIVGLYNAFAQYLRFAAADAAETYQPAMKERAIGWVLAAGLAGGVVGPELSKLTRAWLAADFAGTYVALAVSAVFALLLSSRLRIPHKLAAAEGPARPLSELLKQPALPAAILIGAVAYGVMNLLMTATPLAMRVCGFGYPEAADVIKWHVIAMFAPGFITGALIKRFGALPMILAGCALNVLCIVIAHGGLSYWHFWSALVALGLGWNLMFVGATSLLTASYRAPEKAKVQGVNDLTVFLTMISSSAASGALLSASGWTDLHLFALPAVLLAAIAVLLLWLQPARKAKAA